MGFLIVCTILPPGHSPWSWFNLLVDRSRSAVERDATFDPFSIGVISRLVNRARANDRGRMNHRPIFGRTRSPTHSSATSTELHSPLDCLPPELLHIVVEHLPTRDLLNFWLACPAVPDVFPQRFWRSRFKPGMDLGYMFEVWPLWCEPSVDWYAVYWELRKLSIRPPSSGIQCQLRNRHRIVRIIDRIAELVTTYESAMQMGEEEDDLTNPTLLETNGRVLHRKSMRLPGPGEFETIHISTVRVNEREYVSGLTLNSDSYGLGYRHPSTSRTFPIAASHGCVREVRCYMNDSGVLGMSFVTESGYSTGITPKINEAEMISQGVLPLGQRLVGHFDVCIPFPSASRVNFH